MNEVRKDERKNVEDKKEDSFCNLSTVRGFFNKITGHKVQIFVVSFQVFNFNFLLMKSLNKTTKMITQTMTTAPITK
jgi:hypothetical protein